MLQTLRQRTSDEGGFTLIELLVVILIIGILAAIAIPAFLSQTSKASDSTAKTQAGTMQTTMETYASENNGSFEGAKLAKLEEIEPTLSDHSQSTPQEVKNATSTGYEVETIAAGTKNKFLIVDNAGKISHTCEVEKETVPGGCKLAAKSTKGTW